VLDIWQDTSDAFFWMPLVISVCSGAGKPYLQIVDHDSFWKRRVVI